MEKVTLAQSENGIRISFWGFLKAAYAFSHEAPFKRSVLMRLFWKKSFDLRGLFILKWVSNRKKAPVLFRGSHWEQLTISCVFCLTGNRCDPPPPPPASSSSEGVTFHPAGARLLPISGRLASSTWPPSLFNMKLLNHFPIETFISLIKLQAVVLWSSADCCGSVCMSSMVCRPQQSHYVINKTNKGFFIFF